MIDIPNILDQCHRALHEDSCAHPNHRQLATDTVLLAHELLITREAMTAMHRRAQSAERGLQARLEPGDRTLGRALANSAAIMYRARAEDLSTAITAYIAQHGVVHEAECPEDDTCGCQLVRALVRAVRNLEASHG